jgi:predicted short-subunit dehydrogenase-like oxidoreductase (DUF2520 family)
MSSKEQDLKNRLSTVLSDLQANGKDEPEAIWHIGSLAAALVDKARQPSWPALKDSLDAAAYDRLLNDFQSEGNTLFQQGERLKAYAIQALGISLVLRTQRADAQLRQGEALLDSMIDTAVRLYRKTQQVN